ncbi:MAG: ATP-dependent RecD-like DNA helicase [Anaerolineales bacterium]|nr:ATP-dependent RecD-like DNA helicase [Anaerolineales bacterium]
MDQLNGSVERITYYNPENGYTVLRLRPDGRRNLPGLSRDGLVTVVGNLPEVNSGEHLRLQGRWSNHPKHGLQFNAEICEQSLPATVAGIRRYLGSGLVKGIGPRLAERVVAHFGRDTLEIIDTQPERLVEVPDIGPKRTRQIAAAWEEQRQVKEIMLFLHSHQISTNLAVKIYKTYGETALETVQQDPYRLARDIYGVGFKTADRIAQDLGLLPEHPSRIEAGLIYVLNAMSDEGHVYAPAGELSQQASELLAVPPDLIPAALQRLEQQERIKTDQLPQSPAPALPGKRLAEMPAMYGQSTDLPAQAPVIYLTPLYYSERGVAERLNGLMAASRSPAKPLASLVGEGSGKSDLSKLAIALSAQQEQAIKTALQHPVSVLTGGPGTGKTTCLQALISALENQKQRVALASPTGRAAKRLSQATERPASTIHRLLGYSPAEGFGHGPDNPLAIDFLVVDEVSMLDVVLANHLLKALSPGKHLLLVGDVDQLPSVGAGDVLRDIIASGRVPVTRLTTIFRQATGSDIITNAHRINQGEMPVFSKTISDQEAKGREKGDFFLFPAEQADEAADWVLEVVNERIPKTFGFDPVQDIQVLAPMYRGAAGVNALNERLQANLNPPETRKTEKRLFGSTFRVGDKVMQVQNNYDKEVFNGDIGFITTIDLVEHQLQIDFEGSRVVYDFSDADQLVLAYAVTVHKAQGSEFPVVVLPLVSAHYLMLQRNLLYTAITRARQLCVLVGSRRALGMAVRNNQVAERYTGLDWRIRGVGVRG